MQFFQGPLVNPVSLELGLAQLAVVTVAMALAALRATLSLQSMIDGATIWRENIRREDAPAGPHFIRTYIQRLNACMTRAQTSDMQR